MLASAAAAEEKGAGGGGVGVSSSSAAAAAADDVPAVLRLTSEEDVTGFLASCAAEGVPCVVMVGTTSCGPCKLLYPTLVEFADTYRATARQGAGRTAPSGLHTCQTT